MLIQGDSSTEATYERNGFNPEKEVNHFSYTSSRVSKRVYNGYEPTANTDFSVFGYYADWAQYDDRLDNLSASNSGCGWGVDLILLEAKAYNSWS
jgi:chitinase